MARGQREAISRLEEKKSSVKRKQREEDKIISASIEYDIDFGKPETEKKDWSTEERQ